MAAALDFSLPVPKILLTNGLETELWHQRYETAHGVTRRAYFNYETKRMAEFESSAANRFDLILTASKDEQDRLEDRYRVRVPIEIVPTGVDCAYFQAIHSVPKVPYRMVFTGANDMLSNIDGLLWFAAESYPIIRRACPEVTLDIIGPRPSTELRALSRKDSSIRVSGFVDDVRPYIAAAEIFIVPLRVPGGTRTKLFEAMSMEVPVVSSVFGAEGLGLIDGVHLATAISGREIGQKVVELFEDPAMRRTLAEQGHHFVHQEHDWPKVAQTMFDILQQSLKS
jgi:glycosyltransferase involved in cell wall biosynthesis